MRISIFRNRKGQGMVEYILIVGLIALMIFAAIKLLGTKIQDGFNRAASKVQEATVW